MLIHVRVFNVETSQVTYTENIVFCVPYDGDTAYLDIYTWYDQLQRGMLTKNEWR